MPEIGAEKIRRYNMLVQRIQERYPDTKIKYKCDYWYWKLLPKIKNYATVLGKTIWMPARDYNYSQLAHEYMHLIDFHNMGGYGFRSMYLAPQILAVFPLFLALLALGFGQMLPACIFGAAGIILLGPWPSKSRAYLELRGYMMNLYIAMLDGQDVYRYADIVVDIMHNWVYYKMVWTKKHARELVDGVLEILKNIEATHVNNIAFQDIYEIINQKTFL